MESVQSKLIKAGLRKLNLKKMWEVTGDELKSNIEKKQLSESHEPPKKIDKKFDIGKTETGEFCYYTMKPTGPLGSKHILYLHGGGYVYEIMRLHWEYLGKLADALQCTITIPIYPLAPQHQYQEVFDMLLPIYNQLTSKVKPEDITIMGDSAGGGMSLALGELLKEKRFPQPGNIILISPTLDMSFDNPEIQAIEALDPISAVPALIDIIKWYGGENNAKHPLISPIYGDFEGLGKISLFIGTHDILYPDAKRFKLLADEKGIHINYYEYPNMVHIWPLFFFPESKQATQQIIEIIKSS